VLLRAETLTALSRQGSKAMVVTYPEAICEKVISNKQLEQNTISLSRGDKFSMEFITEFLLEHGFESSDFVYEAGQFSVRGGIIDVWSFSSELPFRIEFFGDTIESVRSFEPADQLSVQPMHRITIIPDIEKSVPDEKSISLFDFIPADTIIWIKDGEHVLRSADEYMNHFGSQENLEEEEHISFEPAASIHDCLNKIRELKPPPQRGGPGWGDAIQDFTSAFFQQKFQYAY
jgi:transcription-repair coupling factor (superfamily II helicase)